MFNKIHLSDSMLNVAKNCFIAEVEKQNKFADEKIASLDSEIKKNKPQCLKSVLHVRELPIKDLLRLRPHAQNLVFFRLRPY